MHQQEQSVVQRQSTGQEQSMMQQQSMVSSAGAAVASSQARNWHSMEPSRVRAELSAPKANVLTGTKISSSLLSIKIWRLLQVKPSAVERGDLLGRGVSRRGSISEKDVELTDSTLIRTSHNHTQSFAQVYKGRVCGIECAVKVYSTTERAQSEGYGEIQLMACIDHPCTLRLLHWTREPLQAMTELGLGDGIKFYKDGIDGLPYNETKALSLLRVS